MRRRFDPWVSLLAILTLVSIVILLFCNGCTTSAEAKAPARFTMEQVSGSATRPVFVITDTETGAQYLMAESSGLVRLED